VPEVGEQSINNSENIIKLVLYFVPLSEAFLVLRIGPNSKSLMHKSVKFWVGNASVSGSNKM